MNYSGIFHSDAESFTSIREEAVLTGLRVTLVSAFRYSDHIAICFAAAALCTVAVHYALMVRNFSFIANRKAKQKLPPLVPYVIPFIGSLPFVYLWNSRNFVCSSKYAFKSLHPVRVRLMFRDFFILQGSENIVTLFKQHSLSAFAVHGSLLRYVFSLPPSAAEGYFKDDSGEHPKAHIDSKIEPHNRVDFLTRSSFQKFLTGPGLSPLSCKFERNITTRLHLLDVGVDWTRYSNLMDIFHYGLTAAVLDSMCGTTLVKSNPHFLRDFWTLDHNIMTLFTRTPRFLASGAYEARDRALSTIKEWHTWARANFDAKSVDVNGDDPFWGTKFFRDRQNMFFNMDGFDADAVASHELAFIWGANTNAIVSAFWVTMEVFRDSQLLNAIRQEVQSCIKPRFTDQLSFDIPKLLRQPILQAVYAETLRLRVNGFLVRCPKKNDLKINDWVIPQNHFCLTSSTPGHMDSEIWCKGQNADHPASDFWPGRFLKRDPVTEELEFSLKGLEGTWMPFGGGIHTCPGKTFAKLVICLTTALMVTMYDCEVIADKASMSMSTRNFGFGTLSPAGEIPVMIRRRAMGKGRS